MQQHLRKVSSLIPGQTQYLLDCTCKSYVTVWSIVLKPQTALWGVNVRSSDTCHVISQNSSATTSWRQVLQTCQIWQHFVVWYWKCLWNLLHFRTNNQTDWFWAPLLKLPCKWAQRKVNRSIKKNDLHDWETFLASLWTWKAPQTVIIDRSLQSTHRHCHDKALCQLTLRSGMAFWQTSS